MSFKPALAQRISSVVPWNFGRVENGARASLEIENKVGKDGYAGT